MIFCWPISNQGLTSQGFYIQKNVFSFEREEERIAKEAQQRKDKEFEDFISLLNKCRQWHEADTLRKYIDVAEHYAIKNNTLTDEMKQSFAWARGKANWYDPLIASEDEYLTDSDRSKVFSREEKKEKKEWN